MKQFAVWFLMVVLLASGLSSCGVMFGGSKFTGSIIAKDHPKAKIYVNGNMIGQGAGVGLYPRNKSLTVELRQEGCETKVETFDNTFRAGNFILSLLMWGIPGIIIDVATGASYKPDHVHNPSIEQETIKNFIFMVKYPDCPTN